MTQCNDTVCAFCGQATGHSPRCSVSRFGAKGIRVPRDSRAAAAVRAEENDRWAGGGYRRIAELEAEVAKLSESGLRLSDQSISLGCRHARTVDGAWDEAVGRLREVYDAQIARFPGCTLTLAIERSTTGDPLPGTEA